MPERETVSPTLTGGGGWIQPPLTRQRQMLQGVASDPGERAPIVAEIGSLEHPEPSSAQTWHTRVIASRARAPGHSWREDVTVSHTSEVSLHGNCV